MNVIGCPDIGIGAETEPLLSVNKPDTLKLAPAATHGLPDGDTNPILREDGWLDEATLLHSLVW
jgi:hypothetical protein